jgi:MFS family permease
MGVPLLLLSADLNGVSVLLADIAGDLDLSVGVAGAVVTVSALAFAAPLLTVGALADRIGPRPFLIGGIAAFGAGSAACALAQHGWLLLGGRAVQGIGGACCFTTSLVVVDLVFSGPSRKVAIGVWGAIGGAGTAIGPVLAATLADVASWRLFFALDVPIAAGAVAALVVLLPAHFTATGTAAAGASARSRRLRPLLGFGAALVVTIGALQVGGAGGWTPVVAVVAGLGAVALALVVAKTGPAIAHPAVTSVPSFRAATVAGASVNWGAGVLLVLVPGGLQLVGDWSVLGTGLLFLAYSLPFALLGGLSGRAAVRWSSPVVLAVGGAAFAVGLGLVAVVGLDASGTALGVALVIAGAGNGLVYSGATAYALADVDPSDSGNASAVLTTALLVSLTVAVAVSTTLARSISGPDEQAGLRLALALAAVVAAVGSAVPAYRRRARPAAAPS